MHSVAASRAEQTLQDGTGEPMNIAILDDYQKVALEMADWSALSGRAEITVFNDHLADASALSNIL